MKILMVIIMFFLFAGFFIISEKNLTLKEEKNRVEFGKLYFEWMDNTFEDLKSVTGYVVELGWLPDSE